MSRAKRERKLLALLLACALLAWGTAALAAGQGRRTETGYAAVQLAAADLLEDCFRQVRTYKEELGIPLSELDYHQTGMIGESYTGITTTLGAIEAKRTTAWPEMGALCVRLLHEAGVRSGDTVGAGFSGSFPAMDLAVIAACQVMGVELIYISSVGASTYGANHPALTFPEMAHRLVEDGRKHGTIGVVTEGGVLEMTTFRMWAGGWTRPAQRRSGVGWRRRDCSCWRSRTTGAIWSCASSSISRRAPSTALWQWEAT